MATLPPRLLWELMKDPRVRKQLTDISLMETLSKRPSYMVRADRRWDHAWRLLCRHLPYSGDMAVMVDDIDRAVIGYEPFLADFEMRIGVDLAGGPDFQSVFYFKPKRVA